MPRAERYGEKLATPDVSTADLIGDVDPMKGVQGRSLGDELTMHFGLLPRGNRGIFCINELLHDSPELVRFVERMTEINRGRALFTDPAQLGTYVLVDHVNRRRQSIR